MGIMDVIPHLPQNIEITLTDLYPHQRFLSSNPRVTYLATSVDASKVPKDLIGTRVMYAAFHHLPPELAKKVLRSAVSDRQAIAIFEATERSAKGILGILFVPCIVLLVTPFIRPFRWTRILLTYVFPVLPLAIFWDGFVSSLRTYTVDEMKKLVAEFPSYEWNIDVLKGPHGVSIPTLTGVPKRRKESVEINSQRS